MIRLILSEPANFDITNNTIGLHPNGTKIFALSLLFNFFISASTSFIPFDAFFGTIDIFCCKFVAMFDAAICSLLLRRRYGPDEDSCYSVFDSLKVSVSQFIVRSQFKFSVQKQPPWKQIVWTPYVHLLQQVQNGDLSLRVCCLQHTKAQTFCKPSCNYFDGKRKSLLNNVQYGLCVRSRGVGFSATQKNDSVWCRLSLRLKSFAARAVLRY